MNSKAAQLTENGTEIVRPLRVIWASRQVAVLTTAIRENASMNLAAIEDMNRKFPHAELCFVESGGDNLAATFSPELADLTIYVIDVAEGEKIPRKGGPGITRSDLLVINKIDLAPLGVAWRAFSAYPLP